MGTPINLDEILQSISEQKLGKSPGIDGIPADFYKSFAELFAPDILDFFTDCIDKQHFPTTSRRAVITLLPKSGDLGLIRNWRPVSVLCTDFKIYTRLILNRLKPALHKLVHSDQTYAIKGRSIQHNLHLLRDIISYVNMNSLPLGIINLDQTKAFDRVSHQYLFRLLPCYGLDPFLINLVKIAYTDPEFTLKINNRLTPPSPFRRGLRQGCSLSVALYILALEPLLNKIRATNAIQGFDCMTKQIKLSAFADDVTIFLSSESSFQPLQEVIQVFEKATNALINYEKSSGLWGGSWENRRDAPLQIKWTKKPVKMLGILLGNSDTSFLNYANMQEKIKQTLARWKGVVHNLSFRGRMLVVNQLCASQLWHKFTILTPPKNLVTELQRLFIDFFWQGHHWTQKELLYFPVEEGGQGLISLKARLFDFRLSFLKELLLNLDAPRHNCYRVAQLLLRQIHGLGYDYQLFLCKGLPKLPNSAFLNMFYNDLLQTLTTNYYMEKMEENLLLPSLAEQNLLYNDRISLVDLYMPVQTFISAQITKVADIAPPEMNGFITVSSFQERMSIRSYRIASTLFQKLIDALPADWKRMIEGKAQAAHQLSAYNEGSNLPNLKICCGKNNMTQPLFNVPKRTFYFFYVHSSSSHLHLVKIPWEVDVCHPHDYNFFLSTYLKPTLKKNADIQWKFLYGAFFSGQKLHSLGFLPSSRCLFCNSTETYIHAFLSCPRFYGLFRLLKLHTALITDCDPPVSWYIFGPPYTKSSKKMRLVNWLIITAKTAAWITRGKRMQNKSPVDAYAVYLGLIRQRLAVEYQWYKRRYNGTLFDKQWLPGTFYHININGDIIIREH